MTGGADMIQLEGHTRAAFLARATLAAGATMGAGAVGPFVRRALAQDGAGDVEILNYALTLEYLESAFYATALKQVRGLSGDVRALTQELAENEDAHVDALVTAIKGAGGKPVQQPGVSFGNAFASESSYLKLANVFEDTGVSAYNGAAPMISSTEILAAAGSIAQVEARHAALVRLQRDKPPAPLAFDRASEMDEVVKAVTPFLTG
jgi:rubrerythrin